MEWNGAKNNFKPLAFVGKGVTFDTGGYSLKPARFMEDMTYDMAGSAAVAGRTRNSINMPHQNARASFSKKKNMVVKVVQRPGKYKINA